MLVIDEFGTFAGMAARIHHRTGATGPLPALDQRRQIEWQGRVAGHRLLVAVHQPNLRLFADSDSRASYGYRIITGAYTASLWRMTFGLRAADRMGRPDQGTRRGRHRGSIQPHPPRADRLAARRRTPPLRPDRPAAPRLVHAEMRPAPWITPRVLAEGRKLAGASLVTIPASPVPALAAVPVPPGQQAPPPAETPSGVPPRDTPADQARQVARDDLIAGIEDAAGYLGYDKADSFRRARTRHPIPGETRTSGGRPAWTTRALLSWRSQRRRHRPAPENLPQDGGGAP